MMCTHQIRKAAADASCFRRLGRLLIVDTGSSGSFVEKRVREVGLHRIIRPAQSQWINRDAPWRANPRAGMHSHRFGIGPARCGILCRGSFGLHRIAGAAKEEDLTLGAQTLPVASGHHGRSGLWVALRIPEIWLLPGSNHVSSSIPGYNNPTHVIHLRRKGQPH